MNADIAKHGNKKKRKIQNKVYDMLHFMQERKKNIYYLLDFD